MHFIEKMLQVDAGPPFSRLLLAFLILFDALAVRRAEWKF